MLDERLGVPVLLRRHLTRLELAVAIGALFAAQLHEITMAAV